MCLASCSTNHRLTVLQSKDKWGILRELRYSGDDDHAATITFVSTCQLLAPHSVHHADCSISRCARTPRAQREHGWLLRSMMS